MENHLPSRLASTLRSGFSISSDKSTPSYEMSPARTMSCQLFATREDLEHQAVQLKGRGGWYSKYTIQLAEVKRSTFFEEA